MTVNPSEPVVYEHPEPVFLDEDGCVTIFCKAYDLQVKARVKRAPAGGARYAKKWDHVPSKIMDMLYFWKKNMYCNDKITSEKAKQMFGLGMGIKQDPCQARLSEMVALKAVIQHPGVKDAEHNNTAAPLYELNHPVIEMLFSNGGQVGKKEEGEDPAPFEDPGPTPIPDSVHIPGEERAIKEGTP